MIEFLLIILQYSLHALILRKVVRYNVFKNCYYRVVVSEAERQMVLAQLMRNEGIKTKLYVYSIQFLGQLNTFQLKAYISCSLYNLEQA